MLPQRGISLLCLTLSGLFPAVASPSSFINFETAPVHPIDLSPDGTTLAVCNLPDNRVDLFDVSSGTPQATGSVLVGVDPVSVRWFSTDELWVVNHISSSVSVVDVARRHVTATIQTKAGPADVVFAGAPRRAFVSCAKEDTVQVIDPVVRMVLTNLVIDGDRPKALAVSPDGAKVYAAIFESGNGTTIIAPALTSVDNVPGLSALEDTNGPYAGQTPPPNSGTSFMPAINPAIPSNQPPPRVSHIVKKNAAGRWLDDNHGDWTEFISGTNASLSGRVAGWDMPDRDLVVIDTATLGTTYVSGLMNICMAVACNPASGRVAVIGTDGTNERRFQSSLQSTFLRVELAQVDLATGQKSIKDLNPHLDYVTRHLPVSERDKSIGDPRAIVWNSTGTRGYVAGMGSRNLIVIDADGDRIGAKPVEVGDGPVGMALDEPRGRLYVLNRFSATISVVDLLSETEVATVALFDPTPDVIKRGRRHFYDTRQNSGLGQVSCASCHVDGRMDRLAWDLGEPSGDLLTRSNVFIIAAGTNEFFPRSFTFHPMKGPMVTQTFQDIIGHEPFHWRGDRVGLEEFNQTFKDLLGRDELLTAGQMQEFKEFLATIHFPPNRFRNIDDTLSTNLPLPGILVDGTPDEPGAPLRSGDAVRGLQKFDLETSIGGGEFKCSSCHDPRTGLSHEVEYLPRGPMGESHVGLIGLLRSDVLPFKGPQLRNMADKAGLFLLQTNSRSGFGFFHDGRVDTLRRLLGDGFGISSQQDDGEGDSSTGLNLIAFLLSVSASDPGIPGTSVFVSAKEVPAALGRQVAVRSAEVTLLLQQLLALAGSNRIDLIAGGVQEGLARNWFYDRLRNLFQSDRNGEAISLDSLMALASSHDELVFTAVPEGTGLRLAVDRDSDGYFNRTELDLGFNPQDPVSHGTNSPPRLEGTFTIAAYPEQPLSIPLRAFDSDLPLQTLTFHLLSNAPPGASINPTSGLFTWTPPRLEPVTRYTIGLEVVDSGVPSLSEERALDVFVTDSGPLEIVNTWVSEGGALIWFRAIPGEHYRLEFKNALDDVSWTTTTDYIAFSPTDSLFNSGAFTQSSRRFYRVVWVR